MPSVRTLPLRSTATEQDHRSDRIQAELEKSGFRDLKGEYHGTSAFLRYDDRVFHTSSTYGRGTEQVGGTRYYLDMTALGRQEDWEERRGGASGAPTASDVGVRYHDEYEGRR